MSLHILFDLDGTLLNFREAEYDALASLFNHFSMDSAEENFQLFSQINQSQWDLFEDNLVTLTQLRFNRFKQFLEVLGSDLDPSLVATYYENQLAQGAHLITEAHELMGQLHGKYPLYAATNGIEHIQTQRLAKSGLDHYFEKVFISEAMGVSKPDTAYFNHVLSAIEAEPSDVIMVGDSLNSDIYGGNQSNLTTVWYNPHNYELPIDIDRRPNYQIQHLMQLISILP
ncbi:YjjG family noncanonical pyrimidine nucleotidase [Falseniella ignava]|uniref:TIGR02254 family HAD hydrolase n=1 Tax=Falseniella ignava CCUG 37419 TaxID=883112 RepID=K1MCN6_9LACT|nr:YjjG family noncanonical pyrimidine nucleotidase [Falseniella ignava]EKB53744.1 TIGR02254 family HAD hydrolase [Falseniella ignava CCUG 37419]